MWEGARYILERQRGRMPANYDDLLKVPGIGEYTAGAIASIAFGQRAAAIDGNVKRVVSRLLAWPEPIETVRSRRRFRECLLFWQPELQPGNFNQAVMELGALICTPVKPKCQRCPLRQMCESFQQGNVHQFPLKKPKAQRLEITRLTFILRQGDRVYLQKRPSDGLLADLWEFPGVELNRDITFNANNSAVFGSEIFNLFQRAVLDRSVDVQIRKRLNQEFVLHGPIWYTFSHRRWKFIWIVIDLSDSARDIDKGLVSLNVPEEADPDVQEVSLIGETKEKYALNAGGKTMLGNRYGWASLNDLDDIPLPIAFASLAESLQN